MGTWVLRGLLLSLWGGAAVLAAWAVSALLRRVQAPSRLLCWLWLAVGVRFVWPGGIPLTLPRPQNQQLARAADRVQTITQSAVPVAPSAAQVPAVTVAQAAPWYTRLTVWHLLAAVWAVGVLVLVVRALWGYRRLARTVATACKTKDGCYSGACVPAPFTLGILRPRIYLPEGLDGETRRAVLLHEQTHLRRHDPQVKPLFYAVVCLHWFNPLAWLAFRQLEQAMEAACDEAAVRGCDAAARNAYCESILHYALQSRMAPGSLAFGQGSVKSRIVHLLHYRKIGAGALLVCAAVVGLCTAACMVKPRMAAAPAVTEAATEPVALPVPETTAPAVDVLGLPDLDDPANSPRLRCPVEYTRFSSFCGDHGHRGDDLVAETGTPVYAAADGTVKEAAYHYSWGNFVQLDHGTGPDGCHWTTLYSQLESYTVEPGQAVKAGDLIGYVGSTGYSTGPHLHFEVKADSTLVAPRAVMTCAVRDRLPFTEEAARAIKTGEPFAAIETSLSKTSKI